MKINISFLEGSGDTTETVNGADSDGTTIPKLTLNLGGGKTESFVDEEENTSTEKYPDADEAKDAGVDEEDKEASGDEDEDTSPTASQDLEKEEETRAPVTENEENRELILVDPDPNFKEIGIWDENGAEGGSDTDARQIEIDNIMEKLKEVYDMIHSVINKWNNFKEPPSSQTPAQYTEVTTEGENGEEGGTSSDTSPAQTEYNEDEDKAVTGKKRRKRQKKKRRHRRIRRIRRRQ